MQCGEPTDDGSPCERETSDPPCFLHDEGERPDGHGSGAPLGNDNAVGAGPPELNTNATKHGGWSDPLKFYERLDPDDERREKINELVDELRPCVSLVAQFEFEEDEREEMLLEASTLQVLRRVCNDKIAEDGGLISTETVEGFDPETGEAREFEVARVHGAIFASLRAGSRIRGLWRRLGLNP